MTTPDIYRDAEYITDVFTTPSGASEYDFGQDARMKKVQATAKVALIDRVLRDLDILIYCELSALYYMECVPYTGILFDRWGSNRYIAARSCYFSSAL